MSTPKRISVLLLGLLSLLILLGASFVLARRGVWGWIGSAGMALASAGLVLALILLVAKPRHGWNVNEPAGGIVRTNSRGLVGALIMLAASVPIIATGVVGFWATSQRVGSAWQLIALVIVAGAFARPISRFLTGQYQLGGLLITPEVVTYSTFTTSRSLPWSDIASIERFDGPRESVSVMCRHQGAHSFDIAAGLLRLRVDDLVVFLRFYRLNPDRRTELDDGAAVERYKSLT